MQVHLVAAGKRHSIPRHSTHNHSSSHASTALTTTSSTSPAVRGCQCGVPGGATPLSTLGLPEHLVRNVIMARDIVPRAFACDYGLVSELLRSWGPSFKIHGGLSHATHKHLYHFTGRCAGVAMHTY